MTMPLAESADDADFCLSEEEAAIIEQGLAELHAGDKGITQEEFHMEMLTMINFIRQQKMELGLHYEY